MVNKEDFLSWIHDPVTQELQRNMKQLVLQEKLILAEQCGINPTDDLTKKGIIKGMEQAWDLESLKEELFPDESEGEGLPASY